MEKKYKQLNINAISIKPGICKSSSLHIWKAVPGFGSQIGFLN
jgi:hypothetical protein